MNKIAIVSILFGLVALSAATPAPRNLEDSGEFEELSELKIKPDDDGEVAFLAPEHKIFEDYCKRSRDLVYTYIQDKNREMIANIFATFFGSIVDVTEQLEKVQRSEADKATEMIRTNVAPLPEGEPITKEEAEKHVKESVGLLKTVGGALASYVRALGQAAMQELMVRLTLLKKTASAENFKELITDTCGNIQLQLQRDLQNMFKSTKAEIADSDPSAETKNMLAQATFEKVGCLTTGRARKVVNVCGVFNTAGPMVFTMMGI